MRPIVTDEVVWSVGCLTVRIVSHSKTAVPIEVLFGL